MIKFRFLLSFLQLAYTFVTASPIDGASPEIQVRQGTTLWESPNPSSVPSSTQASCASAQPEPCPDINNLWAGSDLENADVTRRSKSFTTRQQAQTTFEKLKCYRLASLTTTKWKSVKANTKAVPLNPAGIYVIVRWQFDQDLKKLTKWTGGSNLQGEDIIQGQGRMGTNFFYLYEVSDTHFELEFDPSISGIGVNGQLDLYIISG